MLRQLPLALIGLIVGSVLTLLGFYAYATDNATLNLAGFFYGIPILLGGLALKAAELEPVPVTQTAVPAVAALRPQATPTQLQILKEVTRYRYGQESHLEGALERIGLCPSEDERPVLKGIYETTHDDAYTLVLQFNSPHVEFSDWQEKQDKIAAFFGPGVSAQLTQPQAEQVDVALITIDGQPANL